MGAARTSRSPSSERPEVRIEFEGAAWGANSSFLLPWPKIDTAQRSQVSKCTLSFLWRCFHRLWTSLGCPSHPFPPLAPEAFRATVHYTVGYEDVIRGTCL